MAKVLSLFDGMACGMLAMQKAGVEVNEYTAYEIDKYAVQTATHNFPMIKEYGDVFKADFTQYKGVDYVLAGFPCTRFSIAQKNNRETKPYCGEGWDLFEQAWRAVQEAKPKYFLFENNKSMARDVQNEINKIISFEPICINSALVSAQNRQRLYWVGKRNDNGTYSKVDIKQPEDKGILLKDILDGMADRDKSRAIIGSIGRTTVREHFIKNQGQLSFEPVSKEFVNITDNGKSQTLKAQYYKNSISNFCCYSSTYGATGVAETVRVGAFPVEFENGVPIKAVSHTDGKTYTVYEVKDGLITINDKRYSIKLVDGYYIIRKLTVSECKRLQTVPEWYEFPVSDTQAYKMLGNGWTVDVIAHLIKATL